VGTDDGDDTELEQRNKCDNTDKHHRDKHHHDTDKRNCEQHHNILLLRARLGVR
jgi:hypothetical protein